MMKTMFDVTTREELIHRIESLSEESDSLWGKMNVSQMVKHCAKWDEMAFGRIKYKQSFLGKIFGKMALKDMLKDKPLKRNLPTTPAFIIKDKIDITEEKAKWIELIKLYANYSNDKFVHPFFGKLSKEQVGIIAYKHIDHHLKQFNS